MVIRIGIINIVYWGKKKSRTGDLFYLRSKNRVLYQSAEGYGFVCKYSLERGDPVAGEDLYYLTQR